MRGFVCLSLLCCIVASASLSARVRHVVVAFKHEPVRCVLRQVSGWEMQARSAVEEVIVRVVDSAGGPSNAGLLQVQIGGGPFGTVCGMDLAAVDVVCRQLGNAYVASGGHWLLSVGLWQAMTMARWRPPRARAMAAAALVGPQGALCPCEG